jgi:hypothetical protein
MNQHLYRPPSRMLKTLWPLFFFLVLCMSFSVNQGMASAASSPLTVTLTSPTNNAGYGSRTPVPLAASVTDSAPNATVTRVEFYNGTTLIGTVTSAPYNLSWIPGNSNVGTDTLTAKAYDSFGNMAVSAPVTIHIWVQDPLPPATIKLTSPASGSVYSSPATILLTASISQPSNPIVSVSFFHGSTLIATVTSAPYVFNWSSVGTGTYTLTASYIDTFNFTATSAPVTVTVVP